MATLIDPTTGRPAYTGPNGEGGLANPEPGTVAYTMPDGRVAYYYPGQYVQPGNIQALQSYRTADAPSAHTLTDPSTGRPVFTGPNGEGASGAMFDGAQSYLMSDGRTAYYLPGQNIQAGNRAALGYEFDPTYTSVSRGGQPWWDQQNKAYQDAKAKAAGQTKNAIDVVNGAYPWLAQMGLGGQLAEWVKQGLSPEAIVAEIRQTPQYSQMFPEIRRGDGTMRMSEGQYLQTQQDYRTLMKQYGRPDYEYNKPSDFAGLFANEIDPNEFKQRLDTYDQVKRIGSDVKAAFYVYAGIPLSDDQLYQAVVDPQMGQQLATQYQQAVTVTPPDYQTFIQRATEFGLQQTANNVSPYSPLTAKTLQNIDPAQAMHLADQLYHGTGVSGLTGTPYQPQIDQEGQYVERAPIKGAGQYLSLEQLTHAFQAALIGGAATMNGLDLPSMERIEQFRQAGVDRARAQEIYGKIGSNINDLSGALSRSGLGDRFSQTSLEDALFLKRNGFADLLDRAQAYDKSLNSAEGSFSHGLNRDTEQLEQIGLRAGQGAL